MNIFQLLDEQFKKKVDEKFKGKTKADENKLKKCILDAFRETMYDIMMKHPELAGKQEHYYPYTYPIRPIWPIWTQPTTTLTKWIDDGGKWTYYAAENETIDIPSVL